MIPSVHKSTITSVSAVILLSVQRTALGSGTISSLEQDPRRVSVLFCFDFYIIYAIYYLTVISQL